MSLLGLSFPSFALGPILILLFSIKLGWLPVSGAGSFAHLVLPAITMGGSLAAILTRMVRTAMLEELNQDYPLKPLDWIDPMRSWGLRPIVFVPGTLWRTWGTRPIPTDLVMTRTHQR